MKAAVYIVRRTAFSIFKFVKILLRFCCEKVSIYLIVWFTNVTTSSVVRVNQGFQREFRELGKQLNDWAMSALKVQLELYLKASYDVMDWADRSVSMHNTQTGAQFFIQPGFSAPHPSAGRKSCFCSFNGSYGLICRHRMAVQVYRTEDVVLLTDCISRWTRNAGRNEMVYPGPIERISELAKIDEDITVDPRDKPLTRHGRWAQARKVSKLIKSKLSELPNDRFWEARDAYARPMADFIAKLEKNVTYLNTGNDDESFTGKTAATAHASSRF